jgi:hypothetical protein
VDSEGSDFEDGDPASDGMGTYGDYIYRKMMRQQLSDLAKPPPPDPPYPPPYTPADPATNPPVLTSSIPPPPPYPSLEVAAAASPNMWLHCVDIREVGDRVLGPARMRGEREGGGGGGGEASKERDISQVLCALWEQVLPSERRTGKFSKVSALVYLLYIVPVDDTDENVERRAEMVSTPI